MLLAVVAVVATTAVAVVVAIVPPEHVDGKTAVTVPATREGTPVAAVVVAVAAVMTTAVAVAVADPPRAEVMITRDMAELRAEAPAMSKAGVPQLTTGLLQDAEIGGATLGFFSQLTTPVTGASNALHKLHQMTAEIPDPPSSADVAFRMWQKTLHNV